MKVIGVIGYIEKYDFVINLAKTINLASKTVLVIDATADKKYKYLVPNINYTDDSYISQYDNVDYAIGFNSMHDLENHLIKEKINISLYDYILIDIDNPKTFDFFRTRGIDKILMMLDTNVVSLGKNKEIIKTMQIYSNEGQNLIMKKILFKSYLSRAAQNYFSKELEALDFKWDMLDYEIPNEEQDKLASIDAQISGIVDIKKHTRIYIETIADLAAEIVGDTNTKEILRAIKRRKV